MTEHDTQRILMVWFKRNYPDLLLFAIPNGAKRDIITGSRLKAEGVVAGIPDLFLAYPKQSYNGLFIELKTETGKLRKSQKEILTRLNDAGYHAVVAYGYEEAKKVIRMYLEQEQQGVS